MVRVRVRVKARVRVWISTGPHWVRVKVIVKVIVRFKVRLMSYGVVFVLLPVFSIPKIKVRGL